MATGQMNRIVEELRQTVLARREASLDDGQLLDAFIARREEAAFELLVRRHGAMVLAVCRRVVGNHHDAEDAFQATFLVLVRKAASIQPRELVGNWLYGVAYQTAVRARALAAKRGAKEVTMSQIPESVTETDKCWSDLQPLLDKELNRLSDKFRVPIVLCDLEGKTRKQAAELLGVPEGTISSRLARARIVLAKRLAQQGVTLSAGVLATLLVQQASSANVPAPLVDATLQAGAAFGAGGIASANAAVLAEGVLKAMFHAKLGKLALTLVLTLACFGLGYVGYSGFADGTGAPVIERADEAQDAAARFLKGLEGTWTIVEHVDEGVKTPIDEFKNVEHRLVIKDGQWIEINRLQIVFQCLLKTDATRTPIHFDKLIDGKWDAHINPPPNRYRWHLGIAKLVGDDTLVICSAKANEPRPGDFNVGRKSPHSLTTYKRQSKETNVPIRIPIEVGPTHEDKKLIQGTWKVLKTDHNGKMLPNESAVGDDQVWHISDGKISIRYGDGKTKEIAFRLDQKAKPKAVDLTIKDEADSKYLGLYTLEDDTLQFAYSRGAKKRPTDFFPVDFIEDRGRRYFLLKRDKPADPKKESDEVKRERRQLEGAWRVVAIEREGEKIVGREIDDSIRKKMIWLANQEGRKVPWNPLTEPRMQLFMSFDAAGGYKQYTAGDVSFTFFDTEGTSVIDPAKEPKNIDLDQKGKVKRAIYATVDDTLRICWAEPGKELPTEFSARAGSGRVVWTLERVRKAADERLLSTWSVTSVKGEIKKADSLADADTMIFRNAAKVRGVEAPSSVSIEGKSGRYFVFEYAARASGTPHEIDIVLMRENEGATLKGIYQIDGDTLKLCVSGPGLDRPKDFDVKAGDQRVLLILQRPGVLRAIDLKDFKGPPPKNFFAKPVQITSATELNAAFPDKAWQEKIAKRVDFDKEHLLYFAWLGSGADKLLIRGQEERRIVFQLEPGKTNDEAAHFQLFAIAKGVPWRLSVDQPPPDEQTSAKVVHNGLALTIRLDKKVFQPDDEIAVRFTLRNENKQAMYVGDGYFGRDYQETGPGRHFEVHASPTGQDSLLFWSGMMTEGGTSGIRKVFKLEPGEAYEGAIRLSAGAANDKKFANRSHELRGGSFATKADKKHVLGVDARKYSVALVYQVDPKTHGVWKPPVDFKDESLWKGKVTSAPLSFEIADPKPNAPKDDAGKLQGRWQSEKFEINGEPYDHVVSFLTFKDDTLHLRYGKASWEGTFKLDDGAKIKTIDLNVTKVGDGALNTVDQWRGKKWLGIYAWEGDKLKICFGKDRPGQFPKVTGVDQELYVLKRIDDTPSGPDPKPALPPVRKYVGSSKSYLIDKDKRTPLDQVDFAKVKGPVTIEFTGGRLVQDDTIQIRPRQASILAQAWCTSPLAFDFTPLGGFVAIKDYAGQRLRITGTPTLAMRSLAGYEISVTKFDQVQDLGIDQAWEASTNELKKLQGEWKPLHNSASPLAIRGHHLVGPNGETYATLFLDPTKSPKELDSLMEQNFFRKGIYSVKGDVLTICVSRDQLRPNEFPTASSSKSQLMIFQRVTGGVQPPQSDAEKILEKIKF